MATYTSLDHGGLQKCLDLVNLGQLQVFTIPGHGIENTNYLLEVKAQHTGEIIPCVLTVYEGLPEKQVKIYTECLHDWSRQLPVPKPLQAKPEAVPDKPEKIFVISSRLPGEHILAPTIEHCATIGAFLAKFHLIAQNTKITFPGPRSLSWVLAYEPNPAACSKDDILFFKKAQAALKQLPQLLKSCPQGWVHGDLFPDNALFEANTLQGVIDFNNACSDTLLLDLCITLNAWSSQGPDSSSQAHFDALMTAYTQIRPLTPSELSAMNLTLLASALRFWASRLDFLMETGGKPGKEPEEYRRLAHTYLAQLD